MPLIDDSPPKAARRSVTTRRSTPYRLQNMNAWQAFGSVKPGSRLNNSRNNIYYKPAGNYSKKNTSFHDELNRLGMNPTKRTKPKKAKKTVKFNTTVRNSEGMSYPNAIAAEPVENPWANITFNRTGMNIFAPTLPATRKSIKPIKSIKPPPCRGGGPNKVYPCRAQPL